MSDQATRVHPRRFPWLAGAGWIVVGLLSLVALSSVLNRGWFSLAVLRGAAPAEVYEHPFDGRYAARPGLTLVHVVAGLIFLVTGPTQFIAAIRNRWLRLHRVLGRVYAAAGVVAAITALAFVAVLPVYGGLTASVATLFGSLLFLYALARALYHIRRREIRLHREWMIRGYAIGLGIATFRVLLPILMSPLVGADFNQAWDTVVWAGFALNLAVAEWWIERTRPVAPRPAVVARALN